MTTGTLPEGTKLPKCATCGLRFAPAILAKRGGCGRCLDERNGGRYPCTDAHCKCPRTKPSETPNSELSKERRAVLNGSLKAIMRETPNSEPTPERVIELAREAATVRHYERVKDFDAGRSLSRFGHDARFDLCTQADCALVRAAVAPLPLPTPNRCVTCRDYGPQACGCGGASIPSGEQTPTETDEKAFDKLLVDAEECAHEWASAAQSCGHSLAGASDRYREDAAKAAFHKALANINRAHARRSAQPTAESIDVRGIAEEIADSAVRWFLGDDNPQYARHFGAVTVDVREILTNRLTARTTKESV